MATIFEIALSRRQPLLNNPDITAYRLFHGQADGIDGLVIERFGDVLIVQLHEDRLELAMDEVRRLAEDLHRRLHTRAVYRKVFPRDRARASSEIESVHHDSAPWIGETVEPEQVIAEDGLRCIIRPYDGFSVGLFLEHRENRRRIREWAAGRRVLNAFSYTCAFSVAAAAGGAASVTSVDMHRRYLEWGKKNFAASGIDTAGHWFFCSDIFDFFKRAVRQHRRFDLIILDPPTFSRTRRPARTFLLQEQLGELCRAAVERLDPGGIILLATNDRRIERHQLEDELLNAGDDKSGQIIERPELPIDFPDDPDYSKTVIARFA